MPIRLATPTDARGIATVHVLAWQEAYKGILPGEVLNNLSIEKRTERWHEILVNPEGKSTCCVYDDGGQILGWCGIGPNRDEGAEAGSGELWAIYVLPAAQRKGVGSALMHWAISGLKQLGFTAAILWVLTENHSARGFYQATGWTDSGHVEMGERGAEESRYEIDLANMNDNTHKNSPET